MTAQFVLFCFIYFAASNISQIWKPLSSWTAGDLPSVYRSFDDADNLQLFNGARIVDGEVKETHEFYFVFSVNELGFYTL